MKKTSIKAKERHETVENAHKTVETAQNRSGNGERLGTVNGLKRSY
jgi:hypothetical protein